MSLAPTPSANRGDVILQPNYFTSSVYVKSLRDDITSLILAYHDDYSQTPPSNPFLRFKELWRLQGWNWLHLKVFDSRTRDAFLQVTTRLFLERMVKTEAPFSRVVALYGLYTFYYTQPLATAPPLHSLAHIPIPLDQYVSIRALPRMLTTAHLLPLQPTASYVCSALIKDQVFYILPNSESGPMNPREVPREVFVDEGATIAPDTGAPKKKGRPTKRDKAKKAKVALDSLDRWLEKTGHATGAEITHVLITQPPKTSLHQYRNHKMQLLDTIDPPLPYTVTTSGHAAVEQANEYVLERLKTASELVAADERAGETGLQRLERAMREERRGGILGLLE